ncbi:Endonuclease, Uma2 family (restriction endonuclease fold) [Nonomuraea maritima]|uniref:Endonuclease, Uma2 family (Restriction endonuclease fold) n=1 Tax=Nonomuraea maritima TaxID=683260 RepID=A0A1G8XKX2_9ACTN|nr:Uma2 family endonuclease [Nonomuraea maritima]SDJ91218.1 Endonuclease, Uma2 family (restriction endonuclease fold) [Nonomuraea maritima]
MTMAAEAVITTMTPHLSLPDWVFPPPEGFVAEDLDHIPDLPAHTELIDGSLVFVSPQRHFHQSVIFRLHAALDKLAPAGHEVIQEMSVKLGPQQRPEPDLIVVGPQAVIGSEISFFEAEDVVLAVEVVSPDSAVRDRERKPVLYAQAGIPHYWRIEEIHGKPAVFVYEIDPATNSYVAAGVHHDRLKLSVPFDVDIDLDTLYVLRSR